ncbi:MAG: hypothetical protein JWO32_575 [Bacteroidetes bacterium]|nr:hypothetical protein [Bacteroidota bacterium]
MKRFFILVFLSALFLIACKKKPKPSSSSEKLFTYNSLTSDVSSIKQGDATNIKANITGAASIAWSASAGDIFGNDRTVLFAAGSCCTGNHTVTCTVSDANNNSESKSVVIYVHS